MNMGKCSRCAKTVYQLECVQVGTPSQPLILHKKCFKCNLRELTYILQC